MLLLALVFVFANQTTAKVRLYRRLIRLTCLLLVRGHSRQIGPVSKADTTLCCLLRTARIGEAGEIDLAAAAVVSVPYITLFKSG